MKEQYMMDLTIKFEEGAIAGASVYFLITGYSLGISGWWWILLFFSPDISMLGYLGGPKTGALGYNLFHHRAVGTLLITAGMVLNESLSVAVGLVILGHSAFDRMLGYGLKFTDGFNYTHLGHIGKKDKNEN